jgi:hypothetical protein
MRMMIRVIAVFHRTFCFTAHVTAENRKVFVEIDFALLNTPVSKKIARENMN